MTDQIDGKESTSLESTTIGVYRTAATIKGGRRFSFGALVVVGDRNGRVGLGYGKANEVPPAIAKAEKDAKRSLKQVSLAGGTLPHTVNGRFGASSVRLVPASPGTGVVAGHTVRAVLELAGVRDCLTKSFGSTNQKNLAKAALEGLLGLRTKEEVETLRGVKVGETRVEEIVKRGSAYLPAKPRALPVVPVAEEGGKGGKGKGGGRGRGRGGRGGAPSAPTRGGGGARASVTGTGPMKRVKEEPKEEPKVEAVAPEAVATPETKPEASETKSE